MTIRHPYRVSQQPLYAKPIQLASCHALILLLCLLTAGMAAKAQTQVQSRLTSSDGKAYDHFGTSVSLNGNMLAIGASSKTVNGNTFHGAVYIFTKVGSGWVQTAELTAADGAYDDLFGSSVSLSGNTLAVGAVWKTVKNNGLQGAAYVFNRSASGVWSQTTELTAGDGVGNDDFGGSVSLNGKMLAIGAQGKNAFQGAAYVFTQAKFGWSQSAELTASDGAANDHFGVSVSLSGSTLAVGAPLKTVNTNSMQGAAYVFSKSGSAWTSTKLTAVDGASNDLYGSSVCVFGGALVIGASSKTVNTNTDQGKVYEYGLSGSVWDPTGELTASDGSAWDGFGVSVSLDAGNLAVGASSKSINGKTSQGAVYAFSTPGTEITAADGASNDAFGFPVSLSGNTLAVGASQRTVNGNSAQGTVYMFTKTASRWTQVAEITAADGATGDYFGRSVSLSGNTLVVGAFGKTINGNSAQGVAYVFTKTASGWTQAAELTAADGDGGDSFGISVSFSGNALAVGAFFKTINGNDGQGAVYIVP